MLYCTFRAVSGFGEQHREEQISRQQPACNKTQYDTRVSVKPWHVHADTLVFNPSPCDQSGPASSSTSADRGI